MAAGDIWQVTASGHTQGSVVENVVHYAVTTAFTVEEPSDDIAALWTDNILPGMAPMQCATFSWFNVRLQKIFPLPVELPIDYPVAIAGTAAGLPLPSEVTVNFKKQSRLAGRAHRGRLFMPGAPEGVLLPATGQWINLYKAAGALLVPILEANVVATAGVGQADAVIWHRVSRTYDLITRWQMDPTPRVQRRRQPGRGI